MNRLVEAVARVLVLAAAVLLSSCSADAPLPTDEERQLARAQAPCIMVLPVTVDLTAADGEKISYDQAAVLEEGASFMDRALADALVGRANVRFLSERQLTALLPEAEAARAALFARIGSELKCNAVLATTLSRFEQRVGGDYGVDSPASATFSMKLFDAGGGGVLWSSTFRETQQSLLSNVLSAHKYGLKWLTVEELVTLGLAEKIEQCPYL